MNKIQLDVFFDWYNGMSINALHDKYHKSATTIEKYIVKYNFEKIAQERTQAILKSTENDIIAAKQDIIKTVRNSFARKPTQLNVFGDAVSSIEIVDAKDLKAIADILASLDGTQNQPAVIVNTGDHVDTVNVSDDVLREIGRKLATDNETEE